MSEGDVSLIQDEDVLRRMWQQTEDFSRKKEIRAHMYRLREERLRNLYSPEPTLQGKGSEFTSTQGHGRSFADQTFQSMKSKEVRDAASPTKEFTYRGQDLKELSNAGWNVESENSTTDNGHTKVRSVQANIEGRYDVEGGTGQFAAIDRHKQAVTEYQDDNTSLKRNQSSSNTSAHEQVVRQTDDGTQFQSTTSSSTSTSKFEQVSSMKQETVPYVIKNEFDISRKISCDTNRDADHTITSQFTNTKDYGQTLKSNDYEKAELESRKVEYPDENTKIIVETRCLPDGTRVTSTRREFRAPVVKNSHTEQHSQKTRTEKSSFTSSNNRSEFHETSNKISREDSDRKFQDIVDHQKATDEEDFKKYRQRDTYDGKDPKKTADNLHPKQNQYRDDENQIFIIKQKDAHEQHFEEYPTNNVRDSSVDTETQDRHHSKENIEYSITKTNKENHTETVQKHINQEFNDTKTSENEKYEINNKKQLDTNNLKNFEYTDEHVRKQIQNNETLNIIQKKTTHQTDYSQNKISNDLSHTHQAWANTLRADTPSVTRPSTRASSPGSKTFKSSNSSLRSSVSPDKTHKKPPSRGGSPNKNDRYSPSRATDRFSSHYSTTTTNATEIPQNRCTSPEKRNPNANSPSRQSPSPNRKSKERYPRASLSPEKHPKDIESKSHVESKPRNINKNDNISKPNIVTKNTTNEDTTDYQKHKTNCALRPESPFASDDTTRKPTSPDRKTARLSETFKNKTKSDSPVRTIDNYTRTSPLKDSSPSRDAHQNNSIKKDSKPSVPIPRDSTLENTESKNSMIGPQRKQSRHQTPPISPEKNSVSHFHIPTSLDASRYPHESIDTRSSSSPERHRQPSVDNKNKLSHAKSPEPIQPRDMTPNRFSTSLNQISEHRHLKSPKNASPERKPANKEIREPSPSKHKNVPAYIKNLGDKSTNDLSPRTSPTRSFSSPEKKSPERRQPSLSPERKLLINNKYSSITNTLKTHRRLNAEETEKIHKIRKISQSPDKHQNPPIMSSRSPSPSKRPTPLTTSQLVDHYVSDITQCTSNEDSTARDDSIEDDKKYYDLSQHEAKMPKDNKTIREPSTNKYNSCDKVKDVDETKITSFTHSEIEDLKTLSSLRKTSATTNKTMELTYPATRKSPRNNSSPLRSPVKDYRHKYTSDFINIEKETEETDNKTTNRNHPRQLVTPSTSPTRKSNVVDKALSTGQSSPTTSVSEFVYYSSPDSEKNVNDDHDSHLAHDEPDKSKNVTKISQKSNRRSLTPSKIPCRSPSPEKCIYQNKDNLPRKSSLKKYPNDFTNSSPTEVPPTDFRVSPTDVNKDFSENKNHIESQNDNTFKQKPPLERRETYEERCRKILGMIDNSDKITTTDNKSCLTRAEPKASSPSISPCTSPECQNDLIFGHERQNIENKVDVSEFISREQEENRKTTIYRDHISYEEDSKLEETSPTKLQDIILQPKTAKEHLPSTITESFPKNKTDNYTSTKLILTSSKKEIVTSSKPDKIQEIPNNPRASLLIENISSAKQRSVDQPPLKESHIARSRTPSPSKKIQENASFTGVPRPIKNVSSARQSPNKTPHTFSEDTSPLKESKFLPSRTPSPSNKILESPSHPRGSSPVRKTSPAKQGAYKTCDTVQKAHSPFKESKLLSSRTPSPSNKILETPSHPRVSSPVRKTSPPKQSPEKTFDTVPKAQSPFKESKIPRSRTPSPSKKSSAGDKPDYEHNRFISYEKVREFPEKQVRDSTPSPDRKTTTTTDLNKYTDIRKPIPPTQIEHIHNDSQKTKTSEGSENFIISEREVEILERVQKSLRKLSPDRNNLSLDHENCPNRKHEYTYNIKEKHSQVETEENHKIKSKTLKEATHIKHKIPKGKDESLPSKLPSRSISPLKKPTNLKNGDLGSPVKSRSISPRKPVSPIERQQSTQIQKSPEIKSKEITVIHLTNKPASPTKVEKSIANKDSKKPSVVTKQTTVNKITSVQTNKFHPVNIKLTEQEIKRQTFSTKGTKKDDIITKVSRTASDNSIKVNKVKNKPEVKVCNSTTTKISRQTHNTTKVPKSKPKGPDSKLDKPKSSTTLNTSTEDNDITIDVRLAKSSRESSPDHICPTPVHFLDDVGTPRLPDEVSEPDDDYRRRTHHTIHETETIVDDIVEINEDDELFVKRPETENIKEPNDCTVSVNKKLSSVPDKMQPEYRPENASIQSEYTDIKTHPEFSDDVKPDECLLSVSEKVNKFAKGPRNLKENKSPTRNIVDEYDRNTVYQDDYTKLSVNDKAHFFVETAEKIKSNKNKTPKLVERPDISNVDDSLRSDDCLLSVSDKVNKFVKTAEQFLNETNEDEEKDIKIKTQHEELMKKIVQESEDDFEEDKLTGRKSPERRDTLGSFAKETTSSHAKAKDFVSPNLKVAEKSPAVKISSLRSSEAVKKAKELFENISSTTQNVNQTKSTKLTDIGVLKQPSKPNASNVLHSSLDDRDSQNTDIYSEIEDYRAPTPKVAKGRVSSDTPIQLHNNSKQDDKIYESVPTTVGQSPIKYRTQSPMPQSIETATNKTKFLKNEESSRTHVEKLTENIPSYQRPTKTSQLKEETKIIEDTEVSSRRGSGKFGVELKRTSTERSTVSSERRRSVEHHQPCIEDIFDLDLLEQMLEKVVGYEQRRRIRSQIRIAKKKVENETHVDTNTFTKIKNANISVTKTISPERHSKPATRKNQSPERNNVQRTTKKYISPDRSQPKEQDESMPNGYAKDQEKTDHCHRSRSPSKLDPNLTTETVIPIRQPSPEQKTRKTSPIKTASPKPKVNRFNEYASAYMKRVGLNENDKNISADSTSKKSTGISDEKYVKRSKEHNLTHIESNVTLTSKGRTEINVTESMETSQSNLKRTPSPDNKRSPQRKLKDSTERLQQRSPSPKIKRGKPDNFKKETLNKTVYDIEKKIQTKQVQEEKPTWVTNRNLKKITSETRTYSTKKLEPEKLKYRAPSPSKVISKPTDVITSSYGPGPLDAEGKPLFGIKALRNGATNYQVKGTVIRQEFHSRNGGEPEGTVSVTAYSTEPEDLEKLLQAQGEKPSRIHGLAAITTTKKFGGDTGTTLKEAHSKEERSTLEQFTQNDRRVTDARTRGDSRVVERRGTPEIREKSERRDAEKKTVRQSSVKSLTEKYIKNTSDAGRPVGGSYPKAGLILRSANMKDSVSSDSSAHAGLARTDSEHSLGSADDTMETFTTSKQTKDGSYTSTTTRRVHRETHQGHVETRQAHSERSFLDNSTKVTGVQDILTRMKNADIVIEDGDTTEDSEARALLNKFLGASVLMAGMQGYVAEAPAGNCVIKQETVRSSNGGGGKVTSSRVQEVDLDQCWDERVLRNLLDDCTDYELRRRLRARLRTLMAEQEACTSAVTEALAAAEAAPTGGEGGEAREEEAVTTVTSSVRRNSSEKTSSTTTTTTKTSKVTESLPRAPPKPASPFAKFRQLEKQNSTNSPKM